MTFPLMINKRFSMIAFMAVTADIVKSEMTVGKSA